MLRISQIMVLMQGQKIIHDMTASAQAGEFISIIGPNGAGKSTLLRVLQGLVVPEGGTVMLDEHNMLTISGHERALLISTLSQDTTVGSVAQMTVEENLALALYKGKRLGFADGRRVLQKSEVYETCLRLFAKKDIFKEYVYNLSGGQRQMLAFVMATAIPPRLLLLDEPAAALDSASANRMLSFVQEFVKAHGIITLMVTHDYEDAIHRGNTLWVIKHGTIVRTYGAEKASITGEEFLSLLS